MALCWVLHLTGDVHQPLHTTSLITEQYPLPKGDEGGNKFFIRVTPNSSGINLHSFWDGLIIGSDRFQSVRNKATEFRNRAGLEREDFSEQLTVKPFNDWVLQRTPLRLRMLTETGL